MSLTEVGLQADVASDLPAGPIEGRSPWLLAWRRLRKDKVAVASLIVIIVLAVLALMAPLVAHWVQHPVDMPYTNSGLNSFGDPVAPSGKFLLGTDVLGRDLFVRILYGARVSLLVGLVTTAIGTAAGLIVGMAAGYFGGVIDTVLARFIDSVLAFPYVVLALALAVVFGPSLPVTIGVISFFAWAAIARVVRGQTLSIKEKEYIEAARSLGAGPLRIMFVDIAPNLVAPLLVLATLFIPTAIVFEATLSYLGVGIQPPTASWGNLLSGAQTTYNVAWWDLVFPCVFLLVTTLAFNLLGDGVRDALDPRTERLFASRRRSARRRSRHGRRDAAAPAGGA
ncbi:MAG TPA: ABC transporter permease [Streptosporangiaceae bacterium]|jgi:peptide/nickel transport system permease protein